jgi:sugar phosphate isomerase/epimerase
LKISLAQWSLHRAIESGEMRGLDFPRVAREQFGIGAVELVNILLERSDERALRDLRALADDLGVRVLLIMVDDEGDLSAPGGGERRTAVENHRRWIEAAALLGCHAVRVNTGGGPQVEGDVAPGHPAVREALERCAASCAALCDLAAPAGLSVLVENHGGLSSNIPAVVELCARVGRANFGTLPDFGNFSAGADRYAAVRELMPFARAVSAKCYDFDPGGNEATMDYPRLLEIVRSAGYDGYLGIEYEGERLGEEEGIRSCKRLLERLVT